MALPSIGGGEQLSDGNINELVIGTQAAPQTATVTASLTVAQITGGILSVSPGSSACALTLPTGTLLDATLTNAKVNSSFDLCVQNIDGSGSGVITMTVGTGWTLVGLVTIAAVAGTSSLWRARRTASATWTLYRLA